MRAALVIKIGTRSCQVAAALKAKEASPLISAKIIIVLGGWILAMEGGGSVKMLKPIRVAGYTYLYVEIHFELSWPRKAKLG